MELDFQELRDLLAVLNQTDIAELTLKSDEFELTVRKGIRAGDRPAGAESAGTESIEPPVILPAPAPALAAPPPTTPPSAAPPTVDVKSVEVISPMVGTFYRSPAPDEPPYVEVGDRIRTGQAVCIIEAMKLMNELESEVSGEILEILVENGQPVEYGQPLMRVRSE